MKIHTNEEEPETPIHNPTASKTSTPVRIRKKYALLLHTFLA